MGRNQNDREAESEKAGQFDDLYLRPTKLKQKEMKGWNKLGSKGQSCGDKRLSLSLAKACL